MIMIYFFHDSCSFPYSEKLLKVSDHFVEKIQHESTTLIDKVHAGDFFSSFELLMINANSHFGTLRHLLTMYGIQFTDVAH